MRACLVGAAHQQMVLTSLLAADVDQRPGVPPPGLGAGSGGAARQARRGSQCASASTRCVPAPVVTAWLDPMPST